MVVLNFRLVTMITLGWKKFNKHGWETAVGYVNVIFIIAVFHSLLVELN